MNQDIRKVLLECTAISAICLLSADFISPAQAATYDYRATITNSSGSSPEGVGLRTSLDASESQATFATKYNYLNQNIGNESGTISISGDVYTIYAGPYREYSPSGTLVESTQGTTIVISGTGNTRTFAQSSFPAARATLTLDSSGKLSSIQGTYGSGNTFTCSYNASTKTLSGPACPNGGGFDAINVAEAWEMISFLAQSRSESLESVNAAVAVTTNRSEMRETANLIGRRIASVMTPGLGKRATAKEQSQTNDKVVASINGPMVGLSSGDSDLTKGIWASYSHSWIRNDWTELKSRTHLNTGIVGADLKIHDKFLAGFSFAYQNTNTVKSSVSDAGSGSLDSSNYTFVPYGAVELMDGRLVLDAMVGAGFGDTSSERLNAVSGSFGSQRWMAATHATYTAPVDNWTFATRLGWLMSYDWNDGFTESNGTINSKQSMRIGELSIGERVGYTVGSFEPYGGIRYSYDFILTPDAVGNTGNRLDPNEIEGMIGINYSPTDRLTAGVELTNSFMRRNESNTTVVVSGRYSF